MKDEKQVKPEKKPYVTPELTVHGDIRVITQGSSSGMYLDADFYVGDPVSGLTFLS
jgi:hypothetical protein